MIGVVGAGAFGTALAVALARDGRDVMLWARDPALVAHMEHGPKAWDHLRALPLPRWKLYAAKAAGRDRVVQAAPPAQPAPAPAEFSLDDRQDRTGHLLAGPAPAAETHTTLFPPARARFLARGSPDAEGCRR